MQRLLLIVSRSVQLLCCTARRRDLADCDTGDFMAPDGQVPLTRIARLNRMLVGLQFEWVQQCAVDAHRIAAVAIDTKHASATSYHALLHKSPLMWSCRRTGHKHQSSHWPQRHCPSHWRLSPLHGTHSPLNLYHMCNAPVSSGYHNSLAILLTVSAYQLHM